MIRQLKNITKGKTEQKKPKNDQQRNISIGWKIENAGNGFRTVTMSAEDLRRVLRANVEESQRLQRNFVNFAAVCTSIDSVSNTLDSLKSVVDDLAGAYDIQIEAETRLEQVMRNTMGATQEQIQSIKDFCSAQQQIGVVGDEVQLAGAQELTTYVTMDGIIHHYRHGNRDS